MEPFSAAASGITLALLFKYSFQALDLIHLYQNQDADFSRLQLQYKLEKCRLYNWGTEMGLADDSRQNLLAEWHSRDLVSEALQQIVDLLSDAQLMRKNYGCEDAAESSTLLIHPADDLAGFTNAFHHFKIKASASKDDVTSRLKKSKWIIRDRRRFGLLISDIRTLIDSLEKITSDLSSSTRLEEFLCLRVSEVTNVNTLLSVAELWKESHPRVASAASIKADIISMSSERRKLISEWQESVCDGVSRQTSIADLENMTVTELKYSIFNSRQETKTLSSKLEYMTSAYRDFVLKASTLNRDEEAEAPTPVFKSTAAALEHIYLTTWCMHAKFKAETAK